MVSVEETKVEFNEKCVEHETCSEAEDFVWDEKLVNLREEYLEDIGRKKSTTSKKYSSFVDDRAEEYARDMSIRETETQKKLRHFTSTFTNGGMISGPLVKSLMQIFMRLTSARKCIDVGVYTGSSTLAMAIALPSDGIVHSMEFNSKITEIAQLFWEMEGVEDKVILHVGPASVSLNELLENESETFDFAFIDADKENYKVYYEAILKLLKPKSGIIMLDNTLWHGRVYDEENELSSTIAIRELNKFIHKDERVDVVLLPFSDGITVVRKR